MSQQNFRGQVLYAPGPWGTKTGVSNAYVEIYDKDIVSDQLIWSGYTQSNGFFSGLSNEWQASKKLKYWVIDSPEIKFPPRPPQGHWEEKEISDISDMPIFFCKDL